MTAMVQAPPQVVVTFLSLFGVWEVKERNADVAFENVLAITRNQTFKCCETETCNLQVRLQVGKRALGTSRAVIRMGNAE